jgi:hypothetical protein
MATLSITAISVHKEEDDSFFNLTETGPSYYLPYFG